MAFWDGIFSNSAAQEEQPDIKFGRFSDSYKEEEKYDYWDKALEQFEQKSYLASFRLFLEYLKDNDQENVSYEEENGLIRFQLYQGSKLITGLADKKKVKAEAKIAVTRDLNIGFLRRLMEYNFRLKYARYALDQEDNITMVFDTHTLDGSPYKLYYAIKELALNADKQDDILIDEFESVLEPINTGHIRDVSSNEKEAKHRFLVRSIESAFREMDEGRLNINQYPGGIAYLLLSTTYQLDYLIRPEGFAMETFENIHRIYFSNDGKSAHHKNIAIRKELKKLLGREADELYDELYRVRSTFGITAPSSHDQLVSFIDGEIGNMDWYVENNHPRVALSIPGYIVGYCLFNYALPAPDKAYLHLYYQIVEWPFFQDLGFRLDLVRSGELYRRGILRAIQQIARTHRKIYPKLNPKVKTLRFESWPAFAKSYLMMVRNLDLTKAIKS